MDELFIQDGYTRTQTLPAVPGLHPEVRVAYRPALARERHAYAAKLATRDAAQADQHECDLIVRHVAELNGQPPAAWRDKVAKLVPAVRQQLLDLVLGYSAAQEAADAKNSHSG